MTNTTTFKFTKGDRVRLLDETAVGIVGDCGVEPDENTPRPGPYYSLGLESTKAGHGFMSRLGVYAEHEMVPVTCGYPTLPYGPQDVRHDGKCDHDSGCTKQAVAAVISGSHAECVCGGGCDRTPASLAFLCGDHAASEDLGGEPRATREAALEKFRDIEGDAVREIWRWAIAWHPIAVAIPDGKEQHVNHDQAYVADTATPGVRTILAPRDYDRDPSAQEWQAIRPNYAPHPRYASTTAMNTPHGYDGSPTEFADLADMVREAAESLHFIFIYWPSMANEAACLENTLTLLANIATGIENTNREAALAAVEQLDVYVTAGAEGES